MVGTALRARPDVIDPPRIGLAAVRADAAVAIFDPVARLLPREGVVEGFRDLFLGWFPAGRAVFRRREWHIVGLAGALRHYP